MSIEFVLNKKYCIGIRHMYCSHPHKLIIIIYCCNVIGLSLLYSKTKMKINQLKFIIKTPSKEKEVYSYFSLFGEAAGSMFGVCVERTR